MIKEDLTKCLRLHESYALPKLRNNSTSRLSQDVGRNVFMQPRSSLLASLIRCGSETHTQEVERLEGCFRTPSSKRHPGSGKDRQEECLDQVCLWTGLPEGEVLTMQSLLSIILGDGHWMEEVEAEPNAWKALEKARLAPGNGYTKGSPNIDATLLDWSGRGGLQAKAARDMRRVPQSTSMFAILPDKACIDQPR